MCTEHGVITRAFKLPSRFKLFLRSHPTARRAGDRIVSGSAMRCMIFLAWQLERTTVDLKLDGFVIDLVVRTAFPGPSTCEPNSAYDSGAVEDHASDSDVDADVQVQVDVLDNAVHDDSESESGSDSVSDSQSESLAELVLERRHRACLRRQALEFLTPVVQHYGASGASSPGSLALATQLARVPAMMFHALKSAHPHDGAGMVFEALLLLCVLVPHMVHEGDVAEAVQLAQRTIVTTQFLNVAETANLVLDVTRAWQVGAELCCIPRSPPTESDWLNLKRCTYSSCISAARICIMMCLCTHESQPCACATVFCDADSRCRCCGAPLGPRGAWL